VFLLSILFCLLSAYLMASGGWHRTYFQGHPSKNDPVARTSGGKLRLICKQCLAHRVAADQNSDTQAGRPVRNQDVMIDIGNLAQTYGVLRP
jgi:hypothetical protein